MATPGADRVNNTNNDLAKGVSAPAPASDGERGRHTGRGELVCLLELGGHVREFTEGSGRLCRLWGV